MLKQLSLAGLAGLVFLASAQTPAPIANTNSAVKPDDNQSRSTYVLGPDDSINIHAVEAEEINGTIRIDMTGNVRLPLVGRIHAEGLTVDQFQNELVEKLSAYIKQPQISVSITEFHSQPVSIIGEVASPGTHQLQGRKTLIEMISMAGGVKDDAGAKVMITRQSKWGVIPLSSAKVDPSGQVSIAEVNLKDIMDARNPLNNIQIYPYDVITVPRAEVVYLIGEVQKPGSYILRERQSVSVLQALSMAGGPSSRAGTKNARILRMVPGQTERTEIAVNLKKMLGGQGSDITLMPEDILFVPNNVTKNVVARTAEAALTIGTGLAVYRF